MPSSCKAGSPDQTAWTYDDAKHTVMYTGSAVRGDAVPLCWDAQDGGGVLLLPCDGSETQTFTYNPSASGDYGRTFSNYNGNCVMVGAMDNRAGAPKPNVSDAPPLGLTIGGCNAGDTTVEWIVDPYDHKLTVNGTLCLDVREESPDPKLTPLLLWQKPLLRQATAILVINNYYKRALEDVQVSLSWLGGDYTHSEAKGVAVRDVWKHEDAANITDGKLVLGSPLEPFASGFFVLTPL